MRLFTAELSACSVGRIFVSRRAVRLADQKGTSTKPLVVLASSWFDEW